MLRRRAKTFRAEIPVNLEVTAKITNLESGGRRVKHVISLREFIVAACDDGNIRVYDQDTSGTTRAVFTEHDERIVCLVRLEDDLVVSVDSGGQVLTWRPSNTEAVGSWQDDKGGIVECVARLDENQLIAGIGKGKLVIISHNRGEDLKVKKWFSRKHNSIIRRLFVLDNLVISCSIEGTVKAWNKVRLNHLATLRAKDRVNDVAISGRHIAMVCNQGRISVYHNGPPYRLDFILLTPFTSLYSVIFLNPDIVAVSGNPGWVCFVSLSEKSLLSRVQVSDSVLFSLAVLNDNRLAVSGVIEPCMLLRPRKIHHAVYNHLWTNSNAWYAGQCQSFSFIDACETVIKSENTTRSLPIWCVAHELLMTAVILGVVPKCCDYNGTKLYWYLELYRHCEKFAISERYIGFLAEMLRSAEMFSVIDEGTAQRFLSSIDVRNDVDKVKWRAENKRWLEGLKQGIIGITRSPSDYYIMCGMTITIDLRLEMIHLLDTCDELDTMVLSLMRTVNDRLDEREVIEVVEEKRANNQVEEKISTFQIPGAPALPVSNLIITPLGKARILTQEENATGYGDIAEEEETNRQSINETNSIRMERASVLSSLIPGLSESNVNVEAARKEQAKWSNESLKKASIESLKCEETASCLAAFLTNHDVRYAEIYIRLKDALLEIFSRQLIDGSSFAYADGRHQEELIEAGMSAIAKVVEGVPYKNLGIRLKLFLETVLES